MIFFLWFNREPSPTSLNSFRRISRQHYYIWWCHVLNILFKTSKKTNWAPILVRRDTGKTTMDDWLFLLNLKPNVFWSIPETLLANLNVLILENVVQNRVISRSETLITLIHSDSFWFYLHFLRCPGEPQSTPRALAGTDSWSPATGSSRHFGWYAEMI